MGLLVLFMLYLTLTYNTTIWSDILGMRGDQLRLNVVDLNGYGWLNWSIICIATIVALVGKNHIAFKLRLLLNLSVAITPLAWGVFTLLDLPYYGSLYVIFNPYSLIQLFNGLAISFAIDKQRQAAISIGIGLIILYSSIGMMLTNPYYADYESANNALNEARIGAEEYAIYAAINQDRGDDLRQLNIISQAPFTTAFIPNIDLLYTWQQRLNVCQYCDVEAMNIHMPDMLTNIFAWRDYADNRLFIESVDHSQSCPLLLQEDFDYLILDKSQTKNIDGVYMPLYERLDECSQRWYEGERYIVLKVSK